MKNNVGIYHLEKLAEVIETALYTGVIRDEVPVSILLVGPSGSAKSKLIRKYECEQTHVTDSITSQGIWEIVQHDSKEEKKFFLMPDINPTLSRRASTTQATMGNLLSVTGDGTVRVDDGRGEKITKHSVMGLITACTPEIYHIHSRKWFALGLTRRVIPLFYSYCDDTTEKLQKLVKKGEIHSTFGGKNNFKLPEKTQRPLINDSYSKEIEIKSIQLSVNLGKMAFVDKGQKKWVIKKIIPVSPHVTLRTLAMSHALRRSSMRVEEQDLDFIRSFVAFTDPEAPRQL